MNKYKLNQKIFASSTCSSANDIIDLELTTIKDVVTHNGTNTRIVLGGGHNWGGCPDRSPEGVVSCKKDIKSYFDRAIEYRSKCAKEKNRPDFLDLLKERRGMLHVNFRNQNSLLITFMEYRGKTESLLEGTYKTYGHIKVKEGQVHPELFRTLEDAYKCFEKKAIQILK